MRLRVATPGPGSYMLPSEFGIYESGNKDRFLKEEERKWKTRAKTSEGTRRPSTTSTTRK